MGGPSTQARARGHLLIVQGSNLQLPKQIGLGRHPGRLSGGGQSVPDAIERRVRHDVSSCPGLSSADPGALHATPMSLYCLGYLSGFVGYLEDLLQVIFYLD